MAVSSVVNVELSRQSMPDAHVFPEGNSNGATGVAMDGAKMGGEGGTEDERLSLQGSLWG